MNSAIVTDQIAHGVHRCADGMVNWYLLEEGDELTIVDTWPLAPEARAG